MPKTKTVRVTDANGLQGTMDQSLPEDGSSSVLVQLNSGARVLVPGELLSREKDGSYTLGMSLASLDVAQSDEPLVIPVIEEVARVERVESVRGIVELSKTVHERVEQIDEPLLSEEVVVERVAINRPVDEAPQVRHEGDTLVIPLLEEALVVEKRLVLREEVRVRKLRTEIHSPQEVSLRSEQIDVTRKAAPSAGEQDEQARQDR